ncbi:MAG TPA: hypothetical protein ENI27_04700 [bacterium]|nr:hypothetical protein [bacterium]
MSNLLSFDIEISDVFDDLAPGEDWNDRAPFHISVAATVPSEPYAGWGKSELWFSRVSGRGHPTESINKTEALALLIYLWNAQDSNHFKVCAWNGLGFDFKWLGYNAGDMELAKKVALKSYDPMFQFYNQKGFPVGLAKVAAGLGIEQTKLMDGADAPRKWRDGHYQEVMDYVIGDCEMTNQIIEGIETIGGVRWVTQRGKLSSEAMPVLKTVEEVLNEPLPNQSWMSDPISRSSFAGWLDE